MTVTVNPVNDAPVVDNDAYSVDEDSTLSIPGPGHPGLLANDDDVENDGLHVADGNANAEDGISPVSGPSNGQVTLYANGSFTYTPNPNFHASDSFTWVCDNGSPEPKCSVETAQVNVTINSDRTARLTTRRFSGRSSTTTPIRTRARSTAESSLRSTTATLPAPSPTARWLWSRSTMLRRPRATPTASMRTIR